MGFEARERKAEYSEKLALKLASKERTGPLASLMLRRLRALRAACCGSKVKVSVSPSHALAGQIE